MSHKILFKRDIAGMVSCAAALLLYLFIFHNYGGTILWLSVVGACGFITGLFGAVQALRRKMLGALSIVGFMSNGFLLFVLLTLFALSGMRH